MVVGWQDAAVRVAVLRSVLVLVAVSTVAACGDDDAVTSPEASPVTAPTTTVTTTTSRASAEASTTTSPPAGPPVVSLVDVVDIGGASGVVDLPGPGPVLVATLAGEVLAVDLETGDSVVVLDLTDTVSTGGERARPGEAWR